MKSKLMLIGCVALTGCMSSIQDRPKELATVPVPVMPTPSEELQTCGKSKPGFEFRPGEDMAVLLLPEDQHALKEWVDGKQRCIEAWNEWSRSESG